MGTNTIDRALITEFSDMIHVDSQQVKARLRPHVRIKPMRGDLRAYDGLGSVEAREVNGRIVPTEFDDIEHFRRKIKRRRFVVTLPVDSSDIRGSLLQPEGPFSEACIMAMERVFDRVGIEAALADVNTGRDFENTVTFSNDGGLTVDATSGSTYETLLRINRNWRNNEVGNQVKESRLLLITGDEEESFMQELELTSGDFSRHFVVDEGEITKGVGLNFLIYGADVPNPLLTVSTGTRDNIALTGRGLCYGLSKEMDISIKDRPDFVETTQVQVIGQLGAVRTEGLLVQKYQTTDA